MKIQGKKHIAAIEELKNKYSDLMVLNIMNIILNDSPEILRRKQEFNEFIVES